MTPKQRVYAALRREPADRIPIFMWFHPETRRPVGQAVRGPRRLARRRAGQRRADDLGQQQLLHGRRRPRARRPVARRSLGHQVGQGRALQPDRLLSAGRQVGRGASRYRFPHDHQEELLAKMEPVAAQADEYFIGCDVSPNVFEMYWRLRGMEQAMMDMAGDSGVGLRDARPLRRFRRRTGAGRLRAVSAWIGSGPATTWPASGR